MTTSTENQPKQIPAFYIFTKTEDGKNQRIGAAFRHNQGNGFNILIGDTRYVAFPPNAKSDTTGGK